jgi:hypothetical protein
MYPDMFYYLNYWTFRLPLFVRVRCEHLFWHRRRLTPRKELAMLRAFLASEVRPSGREPFAEVYRASHPLGEEEITIYRFGRELEVRQEATFTEPDGSLVAVCMQFTIRSFSAPVRRDVSCIRLDEEPSPDAAPEIESKPKHRRFPAGIVYADKADIQDLLRKLGSWERADA